MDTGSPNCSSQDHQKHVMEVFKDLNQDCEDKVLKQKFDSFGDDDSLNKYAIDVYISMENCCMSEEAKEIFKPRFGLAVLPDVAVFTIVIREYYYARKAKAALKVFHRMLATTLSPSLTLLITALAEGSSSDVTLVEYVKKYFLEMLDKGIKPNSSAFNTVFDAIAYGELVDKFREFLEQIQEKGFLPESKHFKFFKETYIEEAIKGKKLYDDLNSNAADKDVRKLLHNWGTKQGSLDNALAKMYKSLIKDGNADQAMNICKCVVDTGIIPTVVVHTSVIEAYFKLGKTKGAMEAYWPLLAAGVTPNSCIYSVLIKGLTVDPNFCGDAKKFLLEMMDKGMRPSTATYTAVIESFSRQEDNLRRSAKSCWR